MTSPSLEIPPSPPLPESRPPVTPPQSSSPIPVLTAQGLGVRFGTYWALRDISFDILPGSITAFIGPNGAGKSTLLKTLAGLLAPSQGSLHWPQGRPRIAYVPQRLAFDLSFPITAGEFLAASLPGKFLWTGGLPKKSSSAILQTLETLGAASLARQKLGTLSGGQLQRVLIAAALLQNPQLLLMDEPAASIDRAGATGLEELLASLHASRAITIVFVSHDLHFVDRLAHSVICLNQTICAVGPPSQVLTEGHLSRAYGHLPMNWPPISPPETNPQQPPAPTQTPRPCCSAHAPSSASSPQ